MRIYYLIPFVATLFLYSCKRESSVEQIKVSVPVIKTDTVVKPSTHNASNALDWQGTYEGILPCADCKGITTSIQLKSDMTYILKVSYLGEKKSNSSEKKGKFSWKSDGLGIMLEGIDNTPNQYMVGENKLFQLDNQGKRIQGKLASNYELLKIN